MKLKPKHSIAEHFNDIEDVRIERGKKHKLIDLEYSIQVQQLKL